MRPPKKPGATRLGMAAPKNGNGNGGYMVVFGAAGVILTLLQIFLGVILTGINSNITRIEEQTMKHFRDIEAGFVRSSEFRQVEIRQDGQLLKIEVGMKDIATRDEVNTRLGINSNSIIQVRGDIDTLKRDLGQTYSVKDALKDMQDQIKTLQARHYVTATQPLSK